MVKIHFAGHRKCDRLPPAFGANDSASLFFKEQRRLACEG